MSNIVLKNINKSFGDKKVLSNFSFSLEKGERVCLMGESGRGKTTLLNILLGLEKVDSGEVSGLTKEVSAVFQEDRLCECFSPYGNVIAVTGKKIEKEKILSCLASLGLENDVNTAVSKLSGGMRRRVALARGLLAESEILVLDEPFKGLDEALHFRVAEVVLEYTKGKNLVFATHDPHDAELLDAKIINM